MDRQKQQTKAEQKTTKTPVSVTAPVAAKKPVQVFSARQKAEAVLSVWSERRGPSEVCRELGVAWTILKQWQERALEGMLQALETRVNLEKGPALSPRLLQMLQKKTQGGFPLQKLQERLREAQQGQRQLPAAAPVVEKP